MGTSSLLESVPVFRHLRIFSFDPALASQHDMAAVSRLTILVPWEENLDIGPVGEYIEVIDVDPASACAYPPVNLDDKHIIAVDGLKPSESNPRFHQQMVYAVAMATIAHFERALGRRALWSDHFNEDKENRKQNRNFVRRLRIYPHALRERNAYYSPQKKALLFGYFPVERKDRHNTPGTMVFTCLSHDIIAHETTHALLDGVHPRFGEPVNPDVLAFHEAFADIVALFQHFSYEGVLRDQIARTRGNLAEESLLGQLAQQFGLASGRGQALRSYLGSQNPDTGRWEPKKSDPRLLEKTVEPHDRGAILVAAVFGAFMKVYRGRTADLYRIATDGTGILREGDIHPDLVGRLADEAARCADRMLQMCIRAIDYCPPVGITFGDFLRAVVTADHDMYAEDLYGFRVAFIESFREWGMAPRGVKSMAEASLLWPTQAEVESERGHKLRVESRKSGKKGSDIETEVRSQEAIGQKALTRVFAQETLPTPQGAARSNAVERAPPVLSATNLRMERYYLWRDAREQAQRFHGWLMRESPEWLAEALGLVVTPRADRRTISESRSAPGHNSIEVHSVRTAMRRGRHGWTEPHIVVEVTQSRRGFFDRGIQKEQDTDPASKPRKRDFTFRAGCTLLLDPESREISEIFRRVIRTPARIDNDDELDLMRRWLVRGLSPPNAFAGGMQLFDSREPFALLHGHMED